MVTNEWMMGYTTGITSAASKMADISGMDMTGAYMKGYEPPAAKDWGKGNATAPTETPKIGFKEIAVSLIPTALEMLTKSAEDKKKAAEAEQKKKDDAAAEAKKTKEQELTDAKAAKEKAEQRAHEIKLAEIEAGKEKKEDPPTEDKKDKK